MRDMMTGACESDWVMIAEAIWLRRDCWAIRPKSDWTQNRIFSDSRTRLKSRLRHDWGVIGACLQLWLVPDCIRALEHLRGVIKDMIESVIEGVAQSESWRLLRIWNPVWVEYSAYSQNFWRQILEQFSGQIFSDFKSCFNSSLTWFWINHVRNLRAASARFVQVFSCVMSWVLLFKPTYLELYFVQVFESQNRWYTRRIFWRVQ